MQVPRPGRHHYLPTNWAPLRSPAAVRGLLLESRKVPTATYLPAVAEGVLSVRGGAAADQQVRARRLVSGWVAPRAIARLMTQHLEHACQTPALPTLPAVPLQSPLLLSLQAARHAASLAAAAGQQAEVAMLCLERLISLGEQFVHAIIALSLLPIAPTRALAY